MTSVPRPQAQRSQDAILHAVGELLAEEGAASVTHARVAQKAGVGRATVYRHWPDPVDLLMAALSQTTLQFLEPSEDSIEDRVRASLRRMATELNNPNGLSMAATIVERARWDESARALRDRLVGHMIDNAKTAIRQAVKAGELHTSPDAGDFVVQLIGPLWAQRTLVGRRITERLIERVLTDTLAPWRQTTQPRRRG